MLKVLLFIDSLTSGGAQRQMAGLAKLLQDKGYQVKVIYYHPIYFYKDYLDEYHVANEYVAGSENKIKRIFLVARAIRKFHPEVVISYLDSPNMIACLLKTVGMKYRLIVGERNTSQSLNRYESVKFLFLRKADIIVPNSCSQEQFIKRHFPHLCHKVYTITNFVDLNGFRPPVMKKWENIIKIIGVGRIEAQKNIECLISATKLVMDQGYDIMVDWYGRKIQLENDCKKMVEELGLNNVFIFHEATRDIYARYRDADLFCLPSFYEGYPNVVCEAMACGLPVICSNVCDNATIMQDGVNGYLFDPHDAHNLAERIIDFVRLSDEEKERMGCKSRELAEQKFSEDAFVEKYTHIILPGYEQTAVRSNHS